MSGKSWQAVDATTSSDAREAIEYGMMEAGALGTETDESPDRVVVTGYFSSSIEEEKVRVVLADALRIYSLSPDVLQSLKSRDVADADWLAEWKKSWRETEVGRFVIAPPWFEGSVGPERILIRINPGMAFGTGTHETTLLCLKAIGRHFEGGSFLDVGTGTGILAIAAAKLAPEAHIEARDIDAEAVKIAKENAEINGVGSRIDFRSGGIDEQTASADLVCANLTAPAIVDLLPSLLGVTCGTLVLSGILESQLGMVQDRLTELGAAVRGVDQDGEWMALVV
ncbi:MAG TPA: 50S ribosomal protein L11 methyltransferase [Pyrinomonadaceae bacterium]|nr:50S ribosomal protein L11 methyltransferase [Pyrinomonadaceae bacterium]